MKLNLLPTYVSKEKQGKTALILSTLIALASIAGAAGLVVISRNNLRDAKVKVAEMKPRAEQAYQISLQADEVMKQAEGIIRNTKLAEAMLAHNAVYPNFYDSVKPYIPAFFRVTSMSVTPQDADNAVLTLTGVVGSYQQYADLNLALLRIPKASSVSRAGYQLDDTFIPNLTEVDQFGRPRKQSESPVPDDPLERLAFLEQQGSVTGYAGVGGFGSTDSVERGAMPNSSLVTVNVTLQAKLQTPDPRSTLSRQTGGAGAAPAPNLTLGPPGGGRGGGGAGRAVGGAAGEDGIDR